MLRDYQEQIKIDARTALRKYKAIMIQSATGSGKTVTASSMIKSSIDKGLVSGFCVHRKELLDQTANTFEKFGIPFGIVASGYCPNFYQPVQIFSIDTLKNRLDSLPVKIDVLHIDEAHHAKADGWYKVIDHFKEAKSYVIGWSATPQRLDGKPLDTFDYIVQGPQPSELIAQGHLAEYELYSFNTGGKVVKKVVDEWIKKGKNLKTIGFAKSRKIAEQYSQMFRDAGIKSVALDSFTKKEERRKKLIEFANGEIQVIWNCRLFGEGYDIAANTGMDVRVGCVIDSSPSQSLTDWIQRCGRALRPGGESVILDMAGNYFIHGTPCQDRIWTLAGREEQQKLDGETVKSRQCVSCHHVARGTPAKCPNCGEPFPVQELNVEYIDEELQKIEIEKERAAKLKERSEARDLEQLKRVEEKNGHKEGWAKHVQAAREKKEDLRRRLFNLVVSVESIGLDIETVSKSEIKKLKPKELETEIERLKNEIGGQECFQKRVKL